MAHTKVSGRRQSNRYEGGLGSFNAIIPLGIGAVTTQTKLVGAIPKNCRIIGIQYQGQAAVTGTSLTAEAFLRTAAGAAGATLQSAATSIAFASAAAALSSSDAAMTATPANRVAVEGRAVEVVITATAITAGPGDLAVTVRFEPK